MSIAEKFSNLIDRITPSAAESSSYSTHLKTVSRTVEGALATNRTEQIGSFSRGTAVRGVSDLDLLVVLSSNERRWGGMTRNRRRS